jgi:hypothetical protein
MIKEFSSEPGYIGAVFTCPILGTITAIRRNIVKISYELQDSLHDLPTKGFGFLLSFGGH